MDGSDLPAGEDGIAAAEAEIGAVLRGLRKTEKLSQQALADRANISLGAVKNIESGKGSSLRTLLRVLRALDRLDWLEALERPEPTFNPFDLTP